jgi:hypothetical protein
MTGIENLWLEHNSISYSTNTNLIAQSVQWTVKGVDNRSCILGRDRDLFLHHRIQSSSDAQPAS